MLKKWLHKNILFFVFSVACIRFEIDSRWCAIVEKLEKCVWLFCQENHTDFRQSCRCCCSKRFWNWNIFVIFFKKYCSCSSNYNRYVEISWCARQWREHRRTTTTTTSNGYRGTSQRSDWRHERWFLGFVVGSAVVVVCGGGTARQCWRESGAVWAVERCHARHAVVVATIDQTVACVAIYFTTIIHNDIWNNNNKKFCCDWWLAFR